MNKRIIIIALAGIVLAGSWVLFRTFKNSGNPGELAVSGTVEVTEVDLGFKMPGRIVGLYVDEGQKVRKGERLAVLDDAELRSIVGQSRAVVRHAEADLMRAQKDYDRTQQLAADGVLSSQQLDGATRNHAVALSQLDQARAALKAAEVRLDDTILLAPASGVVLDRAAEPGETVSAGRPVYTIGELDEPWIRVYVRESKLGLVKLGQHAAVTVDTFPGKVYEGTVTQIASEAEFTPKNVQTQEERVKLVFGVKVSVQNQNDELKPGMPADVKINIR